MQTINKINLVMVSSFITLARVVSDLVMLSRDYITGNTTNHTADFLELTFPWDRSVSNQ